MNEGRAHGDEAESNDQRWQVEPGTNDFEYQVGWDLNGDVGQVEDCQSPVEAVTDQVEVFG